MLFDADGEGLKTAPAETKGTHVRRHVALFWSCDPPEEEAGETAVAVLGQRRAAKQSGEN